MFGLWEFRVPQFIAVRSQGRAGVAGAAAMGLLVGIVAAPCVGPVVAALFVLVASLAKPAIGFLMFATLGFGLGFPYLVALNALPRPGEWMVHVKRAMGFVLVAMAFYFLRAVVGEEVFRWGVAASLLIGAVFLFIVRGGGARALRLAFAVVLLIGGAAKSRAVQAIAPALFGAPVSVPAGKPERKASTGVRSSRRRPCTCVTRCMTWL